MSYHPGMIQVTNVYIAADSTPNTFAIWIVVNNQTRHAYARDLPEAQAMREYEVLTGLLRGKVTPEAGSIADGK